MKFPFSYQLGEVDCGPTCLKMVAAYHGRNYEIEFLKKKCRMKREGVSMLDIFKAAKKIGFHCIGAKMEMDQLREIVQQMPAILHCNNHFVVLYKTSGKNKVFHIADPANGLVELNENDFKKYWVPQKPKGGARAKFSKNNSASKIGCALILEPTAGFYK